MARQRSGNIDAVMKTAEHRERHIPRIARPHLAQEFKDRNQFDHAESITYFLTPRARMLSKGEISPGFRT